MKFGIFGTGPVGQTIAAKLRNLGHDVMVGTRDVEKTIANKERSPMGTPPFSEWHKVHKDVKLGTFAQSAAFGEMIFICTNGFGTLEALQRVQPDTLKGKTVVDVSNPLNFSKGMPPTLISKWANTNSLGEEVQRALPEAHVVKSLNIVYCEVMVNAQKTGGDPTMFVAGNNAGAKDQVKKVLKEFGWSDIIDLGDITGSRGMEMLVMAWVRIWAATQNGYFGFKVMRPSS